MFKYSGGDASCQGDDDVVQAFYYWHGIKTRIEELQESIEAMTIEQVFELIDKQEVIQKLQEYVNREIDEDSLDFEVISTDDEITIIISAIYTEE